MDQNVQCEQCLNGVTHSYLELVNINIMVFVQCNMALFGLRMIYLIAKNKNSFLFQCCGDDNLINESIAIIAPRNSTKKQHLTNMQQSHIEIYNNIEESSISKNSSQNDLPNKPNEAQSRVTRQRSTKPV